ncbi:MAG: outer membrane lipid asymmetry maintenance protein MlaD [Dongiaceae bacterium]
MHRNIIETIMGGVVLIVAVVFLVFAYTSTSSGTVSGYPVTAKFGNVSGIGPGSDVKLSGIKVGSVIDTELDPQDYTAVVSLSVANSVELPTDSSARILSDGLLGGSYLELQPGADDTMIEPGGQITTTQDPINIVDLLGRFVFGGLDKQAGGESPTQDQ